MPGVNRYLSISPTGVISAAVPVKKVEELRQIDRTFAESVELLRRMLET